MTLDLSRWSDLETRLPSYASTEMPTFDAQTVDPADLEGATVLFTDRNRWCPNSERVWLALELKRAAYVTVLVDEDYSAAPGEEGCLPRVQWSDGSTTEGSILEDGPKSGIRAILERIEKEHPHEPNFFPRISVTVAVARDDVDKASAHSPCSTPHQRQVQFRAASSLGQPRLIGWSWFPSFRPLPALLHKGARLPEPFRRDHAPLHATVDPRALRLRVQDSESWRGRG